jgi:hypothetical protein
MQKVDVTDSFTRTSTAHLPMWWVNGKDIDNSNTEQLPQSETSATHG